MKDSVTLNKEIREMAISHGLCEGWQKEWEYDWDQDRMISQFFRGIDFFIYKRFIPVEYIKVNFDKYFLRHKGIIIDDTYSLLNPTNAILVGNSKSTIRINGMKASTIYVTDSSKATITVRDKSFAMVHLYGQSSIDAKAYDSASITIIKHSELANTKVSGRCKVLNEIEIQK